MCGIFHTCCKMGSIHTESSEYTICTQLTSRHMSLSRGMRFLKLRSIEQYRGLKVYNQLPLIIYDEEKFKSKVLEIRVLNIADWLGKYKFCTCKGEVDWSFEYLREGIDSVSRGHLLIFRVKAWRIMVGLLWVV